VDDSHRRDYYVMRCLGVLSYVAPAVRVSCDAEGDAALLHRLLACAEESSADLIADLDAEIRKGRDDVVRGGLESAFTARRSEVLRQLAEAGSELPHGLTAALRAAGEEISSMVGSALPTVARNHGWRPD